MGSAVSIHAPAWGAIQGPEILEKRRACFNPRARMGRDTVSGQRLAGTNVFQSTRPHGARPASRSRRESVCRCFNPRARMGRDSLPWMSFCKATFQSTRPHGARQRQPHPGSGRRRVSIHAPAWGATIIDKAFIFKSIVSIHAPAWGATRER